MKRGPLPHHLGVDRERLRKLAGRIAARRAELGSNVLPEVAWEVERDTWQYKLGDIFTLVNRAKAGDHLARGILAKMLQDKLELTVRGELERRALFPMEEEFLLWALQQDDVNKALGRERGGGRPDERGFKWAAAAIVNLLAIEHGNDAKAYAEAAKVLGYTSTRALQAACRAQLALQRDMNQSRDDAWQVSKVLATAAEMVDLLLTQHGRQR